ncbi:MAG TPA: hypothetical protein PLJ21_04580 [Pseudobdellovibrionaceae bacterium]|nr:hypothetical protein [Pseudobdellovibrionaceae bacterium]
MFTQLFLHFTDAMSYLNEDVDFRNIYIQGCHWIKNELHAA